MGIIRFQSVEKEFSSFVLFKIKLSSICIYNAFYMNMKRYLWINSCVTLSVIHLYNKV